MQTCPLAPIPCPSGCNEPVQRKSLRCGHIIHLHSKKTKQKKSSRVCDCNMINPNPNNHRRAHKATCQCSMVPCNTRCGKSFLMVDIFSHENNCKSSCTCQRGINYGSRLNREHHEKIDCNLRMVTCMKCGKGDITAKDLAHHLENICEFRIVNCPVRESMAEIFIVSFTLLLLYVR